MHLTQWSCWNSLSYYWALPLSSTNASRKPTDWQPSNYTRRFSNPPRNIIPLCAGGGTATRWRLMNSCARCASWKRLASAGWKSTPSPSLPTATASENLLCNGSAPSGLTCSRYASMKQNNSTWPATYLLARAGLLEPSSSMKMNGRKSWSTMLKRWQGQPLWPSSATAFVLRPCQRWAHHIRETSKSWCRWNFIQIQLQVLMRGLPFGQRKARSLSLSKGRLTV